MNTNQANTVRLTNDQCPTYCPHCGQPVHTAWQQFNPKYNIGGYWLCTCKHNPDCKLHWQTITPDAMTNPMELGRYGAHLRFDPLTGQKL